jgi:acetyl esterase
MKTGLLRTAAVPQNPFHGKAQMSMGREGPFHSGLASARTLACIAVALMAGWPGPARAAEGFAPDAKMVYKRIGAVELQLHLFKPADHAPGDRRPAIVFFFGGGWVDGTPAQFYPQARRFAENGVVAMSAEYRVKNRHHTTPFECVKDGKSAVRWIRQHAAELGIDPDRIVAAGGSAGGHVAACTALIRGHEEDGEAADVSSVPNALILFNPVVDTTGHGYGVGSVGHDRRTRLSPAHHVRGGLPPTLIFHGTADRTVPFENAERFARLMRAAGNTCILTPFENRGHGFFNASSVRPANDNKDFEATMARSLAFLAELGERGLSLECKLHIPMTDPF